MVRKTTNENILIFTGDGHGEHCKSCINIWSSRSNERIRPCIPNLKRFVIWQYWFDDGGVDTVDDGCVCDCCFNDIGSDDGCDIVCGCGCCWLDVGGGGGGCCDCGWMDDVVDAVVADGTTAAAADSNR